MTLPQSGTLEEVQDFLGDCRRCRLCETRKNIVFGVGDPTADLVVLGEAPGAVEDQRALPFVGRAGKMLDKMLVNVLELHRDEVYILNIIKCRPPDNRNPVQDEVSRCLPFLQMQLDLIQPKVILLMGSVALRALFAVDHGITRIRGEWMEWGGIPVMPTFHPAYLLRLDAKQRRSSGQERVHEHKIRSWEDLKELRLRYDELSGKRLPS
jgi:uracil-DNA glycosylase